VLIDEVIDFMEKDENGCKGLGFKDPEGSIPDLLYNVKDQLWNKSNNLRTILFLLDYKIKNLILIVQRLREELALPVFEEPFRTKNLHYVEIDIESFLHFSYSLLNVIARVTPEFYRPQLEGLPSKSFRLQRKWYIEHDEVEPEYSKYFKNSTGWFEDFLKHREQLAHHRPLITFLTHDGSVFFGTYRNEKGFIPNVKVEDFINNTANGILEFLVVYNTHFGWKTTSSR
jgi:hypothetical protein